jgi:hypothetical protein
VTYIYFVNHIKNSVTRVSKTISSLSISKASGWNEIPTFIMKKPYVSLKLLSAE